jgi:uncharacterized protein (DUF952 family)
MIRGRYDVERESNRTAYHLAPEPWYRGQPDGLDYLPEGFEAEGFVHLTHGTAPVLAAGNRYYQSDPRDYVCLTVDLTRISSEIRYDDSARQFPHVYGPLDRAAIVAIRPVIRDSDGTFRSFG